MTSSSTLWESSTGTTGARPLPIFCSAITGLTCGRSNSELSFSPGHRELGSVQEAAGGNGLHSAFLVRRGDFRLAGNTKIWAKVQPPGSAHAGHRIEKEAGVQTAVEVASH